MEKKRLVYNVDTISLLVCAQKMEILQSQITKHTTEVTTFTSELSELKRTYQSLEISLQSLLKEV